MIRRLALCLFLAGACAHSNPTPRLTVLVVVDQLPSWAFAQEQPYLTHGFARLSREAVTYTHGTLPYAVSYTAPGHAALGTGAPPSDNGIVGNE